MKDGGSLAVLVRGWVSFGFGRDLNNGPRKQPFCTGLPGPGRDGGKVASTPPARSRAFTVFVPVRPAVFRFRFCSFFSYNISYLGTLPVSRLSPHVPRDSSSPLSPPPPAPPAPSLLFLSPPSTLPASSDVRDLLDEDLDDARVRQRADVPESVQLVRHYLPQDPPHYLPAPGHGQSGRGYDHVGRGERTDGVPGRVLQLLREAAPLLVNLVLVPHSQRAVARYALPLEVVREPDDGGLGHSGVCDEGALHFGGPDPVPGNVEDVVDSTRYPDVPVRVPPAPVPGKVVPGVRLHVNVQVPLMVSKNRPRHPRPRLPNSKNPLNIIPLDNLPRLCVENDTVDTVAGKGAGAGLHGDGAGKVGDDVTAGLGLPVSVADGAVACVQFLKKEEDRQNGSAKMVSQNGEQRAVVNERKKERTNERKKDKRKTVPNFVQSLPLLPPSPLSFLSPPSPPPPFSTTCPRTLPNDLVIPPPSLRVDGFTDRPQNSERRQIVLVGSFVAESHEASDGGGGGVEDGDFVALDHVPVATDVGVHWSGLEHEGGGAVEEGSWKERGTTATTTNTAAD